MSAEFWLLYVGAPVALVASCVWVWFAHQALKRDAEISCREFARMHPGRCLICAYHRYGIGNGFVDPVETVQPHHCIESTGGAVSR